MSTVGAPVDTLADSAPGFFRRLRRKPLGIAAFAVLLVIVLAAAAAPLLAATGPNAADLQHPLAGPSSAYLLGTDELGRDILSRLLYGARPTILYALESVAVTFAVGVPLGLLAGFTGGAVDRIVMRVNDVGLSIPVMVILLLVLSVFQSRFWVAMVALGIVVAPPLVRIVRGSALAVRNELFVDAARVAGLSGPAIILRHVLPRVRGAILVQLSLLSALGVLFTVALGFLGYGVNPPDPSWGTMMAEAAQVLALSPWLLVASGGVTGVLVLCLGLVGDAVRDASVEAWVSDGAPSRRTAPAAAAAATGPELPADPGALLSVRSLSIAFDRRDRQTTVVSNISFDLEAGETVGLVGESGCGKTTVARALIQLLSAGGRFVGGSIHFDGRDVLALDRQALGDFRGAAVSYVSQEPMVALDPCFRVGTQLREAVRRHDPMSRAATSARVRELLDLVRIPNPDRVAELYPHELSGGMAQRVSIARALAGRPRLLVADEPTTALDVTVQAEILALLRSLQAQTGMAILLVSHDWDVVSQLCQRAIVMYAGQVVEQAPLGELLRAQAHPYTRALLACRPSAVADDATTLPTIPGTVPDPGHWPLGCRFAQRCEFRVEDCTAAPVQITSVEPRHISRCIRSRELLAGEVHHAGH